MTGIHQAAKPPLTGTGNATLPMIFIAYKQMQVTFSIEVQHYKSSINP